MHTISSRARWLFFAGALLACVPAAADETPPPAPATSGGEPVPDWTQRPDFGALRSEWSDRDDFGKRCEWTRPMRKAFELMSADKWGEVLELATSWVEGCPVDMDAHVVRAIALEHLDRPEEADHHRTWMRGLFEAVMATGDGKTPETAYHVIAVYEEYSMLRFLRYEPRGQSLTPHGIDAMSVIADGEKRTIYFNPDASFARMQKEFSKGRPAE
jgi:hypothetical protein